MDTKRQTYLLAAAVAIATAVAYLTSLGNDFVLWDDDGNVVNNIHIRMLNWDMVQWSFTNASMGLWYPLVWLSFAADYALWGLNPAGYHVTNVLFHAINSGIVVLLSVRLLEVVTGQGTAWSPTLHHDIGTVSFPGRQGVLAAGVTAGVLFGIHPIQVESVAWVSSRTNLISGTFYLSSILAYTYYCGRAGAVLSSCRTAFTDKRYILSFVFYLLALLGKPTAVVMPLVLLILDWYPYQRLQSRPAFIQRGLEKAPFILFGAIVSGVALFTHVSQGALASLDKAPLQTRVLVASKAITAYLLNMALPLRLMPFYQYPKHISFWTGGYVLSAAAVLCVTAISWYAVKKAPVLLASWLYYCLSLLPVLGIVMARDVAMADRYVYLPSLAPFLLAGISAAWVWTKANSPGPGNRAAKAVALAMAACCCAALLYATVNQIKIWKNSIALWSYVIEKEAGPVPAAYHNRGLAYQHQGQLDQAIWDFTAAVDADGGSANSHNSRGLAYKEMRQFDRAMADFNEAIVKDPRFADAYISRGWTFMDLGQTDRAIADYNTALAFGSARHQDIIYNNRGMAYQQKRMLEESVRDYTAALSLNPYFAQAYTNRGLAYEQAQRPDLALDDYTAAIAVDPLFANAYNNRGLLFERAGRFEKSLADFDAAIRLNPASAEAFNNRGLVYEDMGRFDRAIEDYGRAIAIDPGDYLAYENRAIAFEKMGLQEKAAEDRKKSRALKRT